MAEDNPFPTRRELRRRQQLAELQSEKFADDGTSTIPKTSAVDQQATPARRAADTPTDAPSPHSTRMPTVPAPVPSTQTPDQSREESTPRRTRRADSEVTNTGMIPAITVPATTAEKTQPLTRREARQLRAQQAHEDQASPSSAASQAPIDEQPTWTTATVSVDDDVSNIIGTGQINSIELRRQELQKEASEISQEIAALGASNPNKIDANLLKRQQELARKAQELNELEQASTQSIEPVDVAEDHPQESFSHAAVPETPLPEEPAKNVEVSEAATEEVSIVSKPRRGEAPEQRSVPPSEAPARQEPLGAVDAHGLDPLGSSESTAWERKVLLLSGLFAIVGIIALVVSIILFLR